MSKGDRPGKDPRRGAVGLINLGNSCFMNSALQCLSHSKPFSKYMRKGILRDPDRQRNESAGERLVAELTTVFERFWPDEHDMSTYGKNEKIRVEPTTFFRLLGQWNNISCHVVYQNEKSHSKIDYRDVILERLNGVPLFWTHLIIVPAVPAFRYMGFHQHDAQEFLRMLLDLVHEQLKRKMPKDIEGYVKENYGDMDRDGDDIALQLQDPEARRKPPKRKYASDYERNYMVDIANSPSKKSATPLHFSEAGGSEGEEGVVGGSKKALKEEGERSMFTESSVVTECFGGAIRSTVTCSQCGNQSHTVENTFDISVPIPNEPVPEDGIHGGNGGAEKDGNGNGGKAGGAGLSSTASGGGSGAEKSGGGFFGLGKSVGGGSTSSGGGTGRFSTFFSSAVTNVKGLFFDKGVSVEDCIRKFTEPEPLIGKDQYECETCKMKTDSEKQIRVSQLPEIMCVHLKRFRYDGSSGWSGNKNTKPVSFNLDCLDMAPFLAPPEEEKNDDNTTSSISGGASGPSSSPGSDKKVKSSGFSLGGSPKATKIPVSSGKNASTAADGGSTKYRLIGLVQHSGNMGGGHYIAYCRHAKRTDEWHEYDDSRVTSVSEEQVLATEP